MSGKTDLLEILEHVVVGIGRWLPRWSPMTNCFRNQDRPAKHGQQAKALGTQSRRKEMTQMWVIVLLTLVSVFLA
jgi:hypothetical protein